MSDDPPSLGLTKDQVEVHYKTYVASKTADMQKIVEDDLAPGIFFYLVSNRFVSHIGTMIA